MSKVAKRGTKRIKKKKGGGKGKTEINEGWRDNVRTKLSSLIGDTLGVELEQCLYQLVIDMTPKSDLDLYQESIFKHKYMIRLNTLVQNLDPDSHVGNKNLCHKVKSGEITPSQLVVMTPQDMFPEKWEEIKKKQEEEDRFLYEEHRKNTSKRIKCKCGDRNVCVTEQQTRSADEPMTMFYECLTCGNRWRSY